MSEKWPAEVRPLGALTYGRRRQRERATARATTTLFAGGAQPAEKNPVSARLVPR
jgi:hypothetical protein